MEREGERGTEREREGTHDQLEWNNHTNLDLLASNSGRPLPASTSAVGDWTTTSSLRLLVGTAWWMYGVVCVVVVWL
jgi:hypothetical protein